VDLVGILNGADYDVWNPKSDAFLTQKYDAQDLSGKRVCKAELQRSFGLPEAPDIPLIGMVSRLAGQKGFDLLEHSLKEFFHRDLQFVLLGTGDRYWEQFFPKVRTRYRKKAGVRIDFNEALAHKIYAGADIFLMPSRYEPCGLGQMYALKYGIIPLVRAVGGLKDTVAEFDPKTSRGNGFLFGPYEAPAMLKALDRALALFHDDAAWATLMKNATAADFSWDRSAQAYVELYRKLLGRRPAVP
jgi:starch synthase